MRDRVVKAAELIKSIGGAIAVTLSLLGGGIGLVVWVYQLRADVTETRRLHDELASKVKGDESLGIKVDQLTRAINKTAEKEP